MNNSIALLSITAISIGFVHTILGPDHYLPFIVLSQAKKWTRRKTMIVTFFCGIGHVLSSVILGLIGIAVGISVTKLAFVEGEVIETTGPVGAAVHSLTVILELPLL